MIIKAHFDGKRIIPHEPVNLPIGQPVTLTILEIGPKMDPAELQKLSWQPSPVAENDEPPVPLPRKCHLL